MEGLGMITHAFEQLPGVWVRVCTHCGLWPDHHVHGGGRVGCYCEQCEPTQRFVVDPAAMAEVIAAIGPPTIELDMIERVNDLGPSVTFTVEGVYEYGQAPTRQAESEG